MPPRSMLNRTALCFATIVVSAVTAQAGVKMNAMCYLESKENASVTAFNPTKQEIAKSKFLKKYPTGVNAEDITTKYRIASLSKVLTTHWAVAVLGPEYRFKTKIYLTPGPTEKTCNLHFEGSGDPYMGRDMLGTVFPQIRQVLKSKGCTSVDTISYDENFRVYLDVLKHQRNEAAGWNNPAPLVGKIRTSVDFQAYLKYKSGLKYKEKNVGPISKERYQAYVTQVPYQVYSFKSRPLHMMLRDFNKYSFNYAPEILFQTLGGPEAYRSFIENRLHLSANSVEMYNGSGYPIAHPDENEDGQIYNLVSCSALVKITQDLDNLLMNYKGSRSFQLADVMAVGGDGETYSTFKSFYNGSTYKNTLVAKTGSANLAITFGGMLSTSEGHLYFAVLTRPDVYGGSDVDNARFYIRDLVQTLVNRKTLTRFPYTQIGNMVGYDKEATLVEEKTVAATPAPVPEKPEVKEPTKIPLKMN
ncbi:D-alanyl-D-alanine carboxypeptidase [Bdellovibrio sp. HCB2-146]|uniref:D-alanyl-D-alanine carboxypeptidase n=1 Tax=Bdellovibrio sp. HCB2-146 TaxID=3394362 RepID=UPI0039BD8102